MTHHPIPSREALAALRAKHEAEQVEADDSIAGDEWQGAVLDAAHGLLAAAEMLHDTYAALQVMNSLGLILPSETFPVLLDRYRAATAPGGQSNG